MSLTSKLALAGSIIFTAGMISYVHLQQATDKEVYRNPLLSPNYVVCNKGHN